MEQGDALEYPSSNVVLLSEGSSVAELQLDERGKRILLGGAAAGYVQFPASLGAMMSFETAPTEADRRILQGAFSLCIEGSGDVPTDRGLEVSQRDIPDGMIDRYTRYLADWSRDNEFAMAAMEEAYSAGVDFYGNDISKSSLLDEKREFAERWPERQYAARADTFDVVCQESSCVVSAMIDWYAHSPARGKTAQGEAWYNIGFDRLTGLIISEDGESRRR